MAFADLRRKPNILVIITDQEREVMHWPSEWAETNLPARRRLLAHGLHFTRAQCNTAACSPSRATFFTGLYPAQHGVKNVIFCDKPGDRAQNRVECCRTGCQTWPRSWLRPATTSSSKGSFT